AFDGDAPPITIQVNRSRWLNFNGVSMGSQLSQRSSASMFSNAFSALTTRSCLSTVVPSQQFFGNLNSDMRFGNLSRTKNSNVDWLQLPPARARSKLMASSVQIDHSSNRRRYSYQRYFGQRSSAQPDFSVPSGDQAKWSARSQPLRDIC